MLWYNVPRKKEWIFMKKKILIITSIVVLGIIILWVGGIIPKQIGKIYGTKYMKDNFSKMQFEYENIEWNKYYGDYIITFKDKENEYYSCVIGPKYFPISMGQGMNAISEIYEEKYSSNTTTQNITDVEFVRTYHIIADLRKTDQTGNYNYYVIEKFQYDNPIVIKVEKKYKLEENANYEFTFKGGIDELKTNYSMEEIFYQFRIINIQKTDKEGLEQRQDKIYE